MDSTIISDSAPLVRHCSNLSCQQCDLVEWKGLTACPMCGKIYGELVDESQDGDNNKNKNNNKVAYAPAVNRAEDEAMIAPLRRPGISRERKRTEYDDAFFGGRGIVVLEDDEVLPVSVEQERKQSQSQRRRPETRQGDYRRTKQSRSGAADRYPVSY